MYVCTSVAKILLPRDIISSFLNHTIYMTQFIFNHIYFSTNLEGGKSLSYFKANFQFK